jgi:hypothetical protein
LIWFLGTNAHTTAEWTNPGAVGLVQVSICDIFCGTYRFLFKISFTDSYLINFKITWGLTFLI